ncbi:MAG: hypothetical protein IJV07_02310 [Alphaproteobacteria bacterium]|nr:hypothetical protein [Alphaproteobacteria bacterium]
MIHILQSPEFWTAMAFIFVVGMASRPVLRGLNHWAERQAQKIRSHQEEAEAVLKKAKDLKQTYEKNYRHRFVERQRIMRAADDEIAALTAQTEQRMRDRQIRKKQEVELRLKMMAENGRQDIKRQMLNRVIRQTANLLEERRDHSTEQSSDLLKQAFVALDRYAGVLDQSK